eukprot:scaffold251993_cov15-Tisochrysis_lutea.AAC.1
MQQLSLAGGGASGSLGAGGPPPGGGTFLPSQPYGIPPLYPYPWAVGGAFPMGHMPYPYGYSGYPMGMQPYGYSSYPPMPYPMANAYPGGHSMAPFPAGADAGASGFAGGAPHTANQQDPQEAQAGLLLQGEQCSSGCKGAEAAGLLGVCVCMVLFWGWIPRGSGKDMGMIWGCWNGAEGGGEEVGAPGHQAWL